MSLDRFKLAWRDLLTFNRVLLVALAASMLGNLLQTSLMLRRESMVVLVPPDLDGRAAVARSRADKGYVEAWAYFLASLLGNVTPSTAGFIRDRLGPLLDPAIYRETVSTLESQLDTIRRDRVTVRFEPRRAELEEATGKIFVTGYSVVESVGNAKSQAQRTYEFVIEIRGHRPLVSYLTTYEGQPRLLGETVARDETSR